MKVLVIGQESSLSELSERLGTSFTYTLTFLIDQSTNLNDFDFIFDFSIQEFPDNYELYVDLSSTYVFLNTVQLSLSELGFTFGSRPSHIFGFNGLPTFVKRPILEVSRFPDSNTTLPSSLGLEYEIVQDRVGMVSPRIILMIINEAYNTVQEGTASKEDVDQGMKLGTNYPFGPFEWTSKIGISNVYETLEAIYDDTKDERYKISHLLKQEYLNQ